MILSPLVLDLRDLGIGDSGSVRAEGLHASDIYSDLYMDLEPNRFKRDGPPPSPLLLETGLIVERIFEEGLARRCVETGQGQIIRPGEFTYEGNFEGTPFRCHYNPDLFIFDGETRVGEIKATWLSSKIDQTWTETVDAIREHVGEIEAALLNPKLEKYFCQLQLYLWFLKMRLGRLYIFFIAGDYSRPFKSQFVPVDVEFSQDELDLNAYVCLSHAQSKGLLRV